MIKLKYCWKWRWNTKNQIKSIVYTVKSGKSIGSDRAKKTSTLKVKDPLSFEIWMFFSGQPDCDDESRIC
jgi:hypothetical protein